MRLKEINVKTILVFSILFLVIDLIIVCSAYSRLPNQVPSHFDSDFNPTDYSSKSFMFVLWGIHISIAILLNVAFYVVDKFFSSISYIVGLIVFAQLFMILIDTIRTIHLSIYPGRKYSLSWAEYLILAITIGLSIVFLIKNKKNEKR